MNKIKYLRIFSPFDPCPFDFGQRCRYSTRPAIANERLRINGMGQGVLKLKTLWKDRATRLIVEPLEFIHAQRLPGRV